MSECEQAIKTALLDLAGRVIEVERKVNKLMAERERRIAKEIEKNESFRRELE